MEPIKLPFFSSITRIDDALDQMRAKRRSGLVVEGLSAPKLLYAGDLLYARKEGAVTLGDIQRGEPLILLLNKRIVEFPVGSVEPKGKKKQYERHLKSPEQRYALVGTSGESAMVVAASESYALAVTLTGGYECDGNPTHYFPLPRVIAGQTCPLWPACSRPDGTKSKVRPVM